MNDLSAIWTPTPKQALVQACPVYEIMYGGAKGGGKSDLLIYDHVPQHSMVHRRWEVTGVRNRGRAGIFRKEFGRLKDLIFRASLTFPVLSRGAMSWRDNDHSWFCECGYRVEFGHLEGPQDHQIYQGQEFSRLGFDQIEEIPREQYMFLKLNLRSSDDDVKPTLGILLTANPLGRHADWVKKRFVDPCPEGFKVIVEKIKVDMGQGEKVEVIRDRVFIPAGVRDNPYLGPEYIAELMQAPEHMRRAYLDGDWDVTPGSFFGDVFDNRTHVIDDLGPTEIRVPSNWPIFRCADWGSRNPAAVYWIAVDNDGLLIVLDELYGPGDEPVRWANKILDVEEKWGWLDSKGYSKIHGYIDPAALRADTSGGPTIAEKTFEVGLSWFPGDNERKAGWTEVRRRLMERGGPGNNFPGLRIARRCTNLIRTLPNLTAPDKESGGDQDDIDTKQEDHAADALRYGVMSRPMSKRVEDIENDDIARWERIMLAQNQHRDASERNSTTGY